MNAGNIGNFSAGTQINRLFDALGYPDSFGDKIGAMVDLKSGNVAGALRNLIDLRSGLSTRTMDRIFGGAGRRGFRGCFVPRGRCHGPHLVKHQHTYAVHQQVGKRAHIGQKYGYNWGPFRCRGRISGRQYVGSFAKPVRLRNGQFLYRGRTYKNLGSIFRDARDGRVDGRATSYRTRTTYTLRPGLSRINPWIGCNLAGRVASSALNAIFKQAGGIFGGIPSGIPGLGGASGASSSSAAGGASATGGAGGGESVLSNPNLTMEDKLGLLMAKLSQHLDKQIEDKMKEIENAMKQQGKKKKGGLFGKIAGGIGKMFGGPLGGMVGSALGGLAGGGGQSGGASGKKPNLQLLQTQLQQLLQKRQQMFQTMSSILKSLHDTSMNAIRNLKA